MKKTTTIIAGAFIFCLAVGVSSGAEVRLPASKGFINDYARVIPENSAVALENMLTVIDEKTSAEVAVVTVRTTSPLTIEQYAEALFQKWGIGKKGSDNGILILVATVDRKARIEVGYGLEGTVTDLKSKLIINEQMIPNFKTENYAGGIYAAVAAIAGLLEKEYGVKIDLAGDGAAIPAHYRSKKSRGSPLLTLLLFIIIFGFRFGTMFFLVSRRGAYWSGGSGGSFGGGFGGFGGGFSGGGGASGGW
ncbi:MAG: TPM domain-containing protein [Candidatus Omnitrophica bacterium]|nr:TPM domain-containing protein [Candidatus Omnitrophota bacterium]MBU1128086.1 TPM domain-containing protein [Candidatus Omnitrophota bacterium]MBU1657192.1 TPM domain-containing protein [Candidatus Omnitrophota bacterium]MBU1785036.1 TPM domain-containing protein [Candidatus Omnitrophota bacterium]MBU1851898.1 TPM domain-containing protein [Candidatus Omnitrophota bacterium]